MSLQKKILGGKSVREEINYVAQSDQMQDQKIFEKHLSVQCSIIEKGGCVENFNWGNAVKDFEHSYKPGTINNKNLVE